MSGHSGYPCGLVLSPNNFTEPLEAAPHKGVPPVPPLQIKGEEHGGGRVGAPGRDFRRGFRGATL